MIKKKNRHRDHPVGLSEVEKLTKRQDLLGKRGYIYIYI